MSSQEPASTSWELERRRAARAFGGALPSDTDDEAIGAVFARAPAAVVAELAQLAAAFDAGRVHSPWRALVAKLPKLERDTAAVDLSDDRRAHLAEQWLRNAGHYCPTWEEARRELFEGSSARLAGLEHVYEARMRALWERERPRGERAEAEALERNRRHADTAAPTLAAVTP